MLEQKHGDVLFFHSSQAPSISGIVSIGEGVADSIAEVDEVRIESVDVMSPLKAHVAALRSMYFSRNLA